MSFIDASEVDLAQAGEIIDGDVEGALYSLDRRRTRAHRIDDLQVAMTLTDDFMGNTTTSGAIGGLGWAATTSGGGAITVEVSSAGPGVLRLSTGTTTSTGRAAIDLGSHNLGTGVTSLSGLPVLVQETRCKLEGLDTGTDTAAAYIGLVGYQNGTAPGSEPGGEPVGSYFTYRAGSWRAVCCRGFDPAKRTSVPISVAPADGWHRFRLISDGAGIVRFYVDDTEVERVTTNAPVDLFLVPTVRHGPNLEIRKTLGTAARALLVDYYTLRWEAAR
jgi:hypothetical protein